MNAEQGADLAASRIALAIGEPARARMLYSLVDNRARTSTELAILAEVSPSTASVHLHRLKVERLVKVTVQGKHRYYSLGGQEVARVLEGMSVLAGGRGDKFVPNTPNYLRAARTCYDHMAGTLGVLLHDRVKALGWITEATNDGNNSYELTSKGSEKLAVLGVAVEGTQALRRRFAYACLDWSERRAHLGGAIGAALLRIALKRKWVTQELNSRALSVTRHGRREMLRLFGLRLEREW